MGAERVDATHDYLDSVERLLDLLDVKRLDSGRKISLETRVKTAPLAAAYDITVEVRSDEANIVPVV
jgi:hypothetical protein